MLYINSELQKGMPLTKTSQFKIQVQRSNRLGYEDYKYLSEHFQRSVTKWRFSYMNNVGMKNETIDCFHGHSEIANWHQTT